MLLELRISNFALIESAELQPGTGFNVLTGETGAGKSILVQALGLLLGERAASEQVGQGGGRALVEGAFDLKNAPQAAAFLAEQEVPAEDENLLITREIAGDGRSRVRLNGRLTTAAILRELGAHLVDLHGQHENQLLLKPEAHLGFLDAFGDAKHLKLRQKVRESHKTWREAEKRLADLTKNEQERAQRLDMLQFQAQEIDNAAPAEEEDTHLAEERARLMNAEKLRASAALCRDALLGDEEPGAITLARQALKAAREIEGVDASVAAWVSELQSAIFEIEDAAAEARTYADGLEADPLRLGDIEARLHLLGRLKRKYGATIAAILAYRAQIESEIAGLTLSDDEIAALREAARNQRQAFFADGEVLSQSRRKLAAKFAGEVVEQLKSLAMERAKLDVSFERDENGSPDGVDRTEFLFSANPGQPLRPLARIASGGEISRLMLAFRSVLRSRGGSNDGTERVPIVVFDEVDAGIGGLTAEAVGAKLREIAGEHQVFCITHLPQIAKRAEHHYRVEKASEKEKTSVRVTPLEGEDRVRELARMMGAESPANLEHARTLLNGAA